jgi:hypothetical protein
VDHLHRNCRNHLFESHPRLCAIVGYWLGGDLSETHMEEREDDATSRNLSVDFGASFTIRIRQNVLVGSVLRVTNKSVTGLIPISGSGEELSATIMLEDLKTGVAHDVDLESGNPIVQWKNFQCNLLGGFAYGGTITMTVTQIVPPASKK